MPNLSHEQAIEQYYELVKHEHPNITFEQFKDVCDATFNFIKARIKDEDLPFIMIKYLGKFRVFKRRIRVFISILKAQLKRNHITQEEFNKKKEFSDNYTNDIIKYDAKENKVDIEWEEEAQ